MSGISGPGGRFAPSPTGPLHIGSLYTALASFLDARAQGLRWRLRFDDLDQARNATGAAAAILRTLDAHGLHWDGPVQRQSEQVDLYQEALDKLRQLGKVFFCTCSRKKLASSLLYPGNCRARLTPIAGAAMRVRVDGATVKFTDLVQGRRQSNLEQSVGDFVVKRRDGPIAYQLATAVDDGDPGIVRVLRGQDLLADTPRQLHLMALLNLEAPSYAHIPVLLNPALQKWSKQTKALPVDNGAPVASIRTCLALLGLRPPELDLKALMLWAQAHWNIQRIGRQNQVVSPAALEAWKTEANTADSASTKPI